MLAGLFDAGTFQGRGSVKKKSPVAIRNEVLSNEVLKCGKKKNCYIVFNLLINRKAGRSTTKKYT